MSWTITAEYTLEAANNPIHETGSAEQLGFDGALVPGPSIYAYLSIPALDRWGAAWVEQGYSTVRFRRPIYRGESLEIRAAPVAGSEELAVEVVDPGGVVRAAGVMGPPVTAGPTPAAPPFRHTPRGNPLPVATFDVLAELPGVPTYEFSAGHEPDIEAVLGDVLSGWIPDGAGHPERQISRGTIRSMHHGFTPAGATILVGLASQQFRAAQIGEPLVTVGRVIAAWVKDGRTFATNDMWILDAEHLPVIRAQNTTIWELPPNPQKGTS